MACRSCLDFSQIREKLGRCRECMILLTLLNLIFWPSWYYLKQTFPASIETLIVFFAAATFAVFLFVHIFVWIVTGGKGLARKK